MFASDLASVLGGGYCDNKFRLKLIIVMLLYAFSSKYNMQVITLRIIIIFIYDLRNPYYMYSTYERWNVVMKHSQESKTPYSSKIHVHRYSKGSRRKQKQWYLYNQDTNGIFNTCGTGNKILKHEVHEVTSSIVDCMALNLQLILVTSWLILVTSWLILMTVYMYMCMLQTVCIKRSLCNMIIIIEFCVCIKNSRGIHN